MIWLWGALILLVVVVPASFVVMLCTKPKKSKNRIVVQDCTCANCVRNSLAGDP